MKEIIQKIKSHKEILILIAAIATIVGFLISDAGGVLKGYLEWQVEKKETDFLFSMKQKCREEGKRIVERQEEKLFCSYEYTYNSKLHTCLFYYNCGAEKQVKDILTNEVLISYDSFFDETFKDIGILSSEEWVYKIPPPHLISSSSKFDAEQEKLFNQ